MEKETYLDSPQSLSGVAEDLTKHCTSAFFYGTLMHPSILKRVIEHEGVQLLAAPALLASYARVHVTFADFPALISYQTANTIGLAEIPRFVEGMVVQGFTATDVVKLDQFEGAYYGREAVKVYPLAPLAPLSSFTGKRRIDQWQAPLILPPTMETIAYTWDVSLDDLSPTVWSYETFEQQSAAHWGGHDSDGSEGSQ